MTHQSMGNESRRRGKMTVIDLIVALVAITASGAALSMEPKASSKPAEQERQLSR